MHILKELRKSQGKTQQDLADFLQVKRNAISRYESGVREPDQATLVRIAEFFGVTVDYLLGNSENSNIVIDENNGFEKELFTKLKSLSPESREKAKEFMEMLKKLDDLQKEDKRNKKAL